jgi:Fe-Mn family superoxide dismutase
MSRPFRITRREALAGTAAMIALSRRSARAAERASPSAAPAQGPVVLPPLPWAPDALAPVISAETLSFHYGKHHRGYVDRVNELVAGTPLASKSLEEILAVAAADPGRAELFNHAAQVLNHTFYWNSLSPKGGGSPAGALRQRVKQDFGSVEALKKELLDAAVSQFGSGWAWLVLEGGRLKVEKTPNADRPGDGKPLLTLDVWEHAYYIDYRHRRKDYAQALVDKLLNWEFAAKNFA